MPPHRQPRAGSVTQQLKNLTDALLDSNRAVPVNRNHSRGRSGESQAAQPLSAWGASFSEVTPGSLHILSTSTTQQSNDGNRKRKRDVKPAEQSLLLPPPQRQPASAVQSNVNENADDTADDDSDHADDDGYESDECIAGTQPSQSGRFGGYSMIDPSVLELDNPYSDNGNDNDHEDEEGDVNESQVEDSEMDSVAESDVEYKHPSKRLIRDDSAVNYSDSDDDINADYGEDSTFIGPSQYVDHLNRFSDAGMSSIVMSSQPEMVDLLDNNDVKRDSILQQQQQQQQHLAPTREPSAVDDLDDVPESVIRVPFNNTQPSVAETPLVNMAVAGGGVNRVLRQLSVAESPAPIPESQPVHNDSAAEMEMAETPQSKQQNKNRQIPSEIAETPHVDQNVNNQFVPETGPRILALETQYTGTSENVDADVSFDTLDSLDTQKIDQMIMQQQSQSQLQPQPPVAVKRRLGSRNKSKTVAISKEQSFDTNQRGRLEQLRSAGLPSAIMETQAPEPMDIDVHTAEVEQQLQNHSRLLSSPPMDPLPSDIASDAIVATTAAPETADEDDVFESSANSPTEMSFSLPAKIGQSPSDQQLTQSNPVRIPTTSGTPVAKRRPLKPAGTSMLTAYSRASIRPGSSMLRMTPSALDNSSSSSSNNAIPPTTAVTRPRRRILSILDGIPSTSRSSSTLQPAAAALTSTSTTSATSTLMSLPPPSSQSSQSVQPAASTPASDPVIMRTPKALKIPTQQRRTLVMSGIMSPRQVSMTPYLKVMPQRPALKVKRRGTNARKTLSVAFEDEQRPSAPSQRERQQQQQIQRQPSPARSNQSEIRNTTITATSVIDSIETTSESSVATDNQTTTVTPATEGQYRSGDRVWARLDQMPAYHPATVSRVVTTSGNSSTFTCDVKFDDGTRATCKSRNIAHLDIRDGDKISVIVREWSSLSMPAIARSEPRLAANNDDISSTSASASTSTAASTAGSKFVVDVEWKLPNAVHSMRSGNSTVISRKNGVNSSALRETIPLSRVSITATMLTAIKKRRANASSTSNNSNNSIAARNPRAAVPIFTPPGARPPPAAQAQRLFTGLAFVLTFPTLNTIGSQQQQQLQQQSGEPAHLPVDPTRTKAALSAHIARNGGKIIADIPAMESYSKRPMPKSKRQQLASNRLTMSSSAPASTSNPTINVTDSIILVAPHRVRTAKFLMAVALGIRCVSFEWIRACARAGQLIDTAQYELANIHPTTRAVEGFMSGLKISVVGSRKFRSQWDAILNAAGATIVPHPSHSSSATTASEGQTECDIVLAEGPPGSPDGSEAGIASMQTGLVCHRTKIGDLDWIEEAGRPPPVVSAEWALESVMEHKVLGWKSQPLFTLQPSDSH
ncbi:hypothetical protein GQ42DRAFT_160333 [Ramicandelaber brevisporus]|nr:hypothetical protein GQ42DRAFT_160333 [Ramicandelaber brevisporus]